MASLAFDKHGKPFKFHRLARQLAVRVFSNPGGRGSCFPVRDDEGNDVFVEADADYQDFCTAVKGQPGQYRLDQYDEQGEEIDGAPPAYAVIRETRNASGASDIDARDAVILQLAESNTELAQTNAEVSKTAIAHFAAVMHATAEILHAPVKAPALTASSDPEEEDDDDDDDQDEPELEDPWAAWRPILKMAEPHLPKLGSLLYEQLVLVLKKPTTPPPAAAISSAQSAPFVPASAVAASVDAARDANAAAGSSSSPPSTSVAASGATSSTAASDAASRPMPSSAPADERPAASAEPSPRNTGLSPTPDQWEHLHAIREQLSPKERAIAENAIMRMDSDVLAKYLGELSALPVSEAVVSIRSMIATLRTTRGPERSEQ